MDCKNIPVAMSLLSGKTETDCTRNQTYIKPAKAPQSGSVLDIGSTSCGL